MRIAIVATVVIVFPFIVLAAVTFVRNGPVGFAIAFTLIAVAICAMLVWSTMLGYRIDQAGIASRQGIPPRFRVTVAWEDIRLITWTAGAIPGLADNCVLWSANSTRPVKLRKLYEAQTPATAVAEIHRHEAAVEPLDPMLITLSSMSRTNRHHLHAAFAHHGFAPLPQHRREHNVTVSRRLDGATNRS